MPRKRLRGLWLNLHRYLGLVLGFPLALIGLSGSIIVFGWQLDEWLNSDLTRVEVPHGAGVRPLTEIVAATKAYLPTHASQIDWLTFSIHTDKAIRFSYSLPPSRDGYDLFVDPYTAKVIGQRLWGDFSACCSWHGPLMAVIYRFHDSFLLGEVGQKIVGGIGLLMLLSLVSGLLLWWPSPEKWRSAFSMKAHPSPQRLAFDLHKIIGVSSLTVMAVLLFTGVYMNFPEQSREIVNHFSRLTVEPDHFKSIPRGLPAISVDQAVKLARGYFPNGTPASLALPTAPDGVYGFNFEGGDEVTPSLPEHSVVIDQYSGALLYKTDSTQKTAGDKFHAWQFGLHSGQALGLPGQLLVLVCGLAPGLLYITGFIRWLQKRRAKRLKSNN